MASLPRPLRPSTSPPSGPLPSIPNLKTRHSPSSNLVRTSTSESPRLSSLPQPTTGRTTSTSTISSLKVSSTAPPTETSQPTTSAPVSKSLQKSGSHSLLPVQAAAEGDFPSDSSSPSTTPRSSTRASGLWNGAPGRSASTAASSRTSGSIILPGALGSKRSSPQEPLATSVESAAEESTDDVQNAEESVVDDATRGRQDLPGKDKGNVIVSVRVRPESGAKDGNAAEGEWLVDGRKALLSYKGGEGGRYIFDNVFTPHDKNARVYDAAAKRLVRRVMEGYHGTVFAYGMTGTGKTFSMQGTATSPGVIPLAITDIFSFIRETPTREFLLRVSYLEIYNEKIHDLLSAPADAYGAQQEEIKLREDSKRGVYATPLKEEIVQSPTQLLRVIARGDQARRTSSTQFNARSSRSHAVVQIVVESRERNLGINGTEQKRSGILPGGVRVSALSLIDLAGSERVSETKERRTEGAHINKSLLTLGTVIQRLSGSKEKQKTGTDRDEKHLPYRDSKLTRLLQPALSGNALISILCTIQLGNTSSVAAANGTVAETLNTLKFAARARNNIVSHAKKAEEAHAGVDAGSRALLDRYRFEIVELRKQLENQKLESQKVKDDEQEKARELEAEQRHEEQMLEMQLARTALKERIEHLNRLILSSKSIGVNIGRSYSSLSVAQQRASSIYSNADTNYNRTRSLYSSTSMRTLNGNDAERRSSSSTTFSNSNVDNEPFANQFEEGDLGENGDGTATLTAQNQALQADLVDKRRYIATLEKRLIQARKSSRSRASTAFANRLSLAGSGDESGMDGLLREKDAEIAELRAKLDDKDRMLDALRSALRNQSIAETPRSNSIMSAASKYSSGMFEGEGVADAQRRKGPKIGARRRSITSTSSHTTAGSTEPGRNSLLPRKSTGRATSNSSDTDRSRGSPSFTSVASTIMAGGIAKRGHSTDELTKLLDEIIKQKAGEEKSLNNVTRPSTPHGLRTSHSNTPSRPLTSGIRGQQPSAWETGLAKKRASSLHGPAPRPGSSPSTLSRARNASVTEAALPSSMVLPTATSSEAFSSVGNPPSTGSEGPQIANDATTAQPLPSNDLSSTTTNSTSASTAYITTSPWTTLPSDFHPPSPSSTPARSRSNTETFVAGHTVKIIPGRWSGDLPPSLPAGESEAAAKSERAPDAG